MSQREPVPVQPVPLGYVTAGLRQPSLPALLPAWWTTPLRVVIVCWAVPLAIGLVVFAGSLCTGWEAWETVGLLDIAIGTGMAGVGGVAILVFAADRWQAAVGGRWDRIFVPALSAGLLLASNFVVAVFLIFILGHSGRIS